MNQKSIEHIARYSLVLAGYISREEQHTGQPVHGNT